jgi:hypothetical protein
MGGSPQLTIALRNLLQRASSAAPSAAYSAPPEKSPRLLNPLAWFAVVGLAAISSNDQALRSMAPHGSTLADGLAMLEVCCIVLLWLSVVVGGLRGVRRWSRDPAAVRIETTVLVIASLALAGTTALRAAVPFNSMGLLFIPWLPVNVPHGSVLTSVFCITSLFAIFIASDRAITFEAIAVPGLALAFPLALTGVEMGNDAAVTIGLWALAASAVVSGLALAITRDRLHVALLAGVGGAFLTPIALLALLVPTIAVFVPRLRSRVLAMFAIGADRIALFGAGLGLAACFGGAWIMFLSPTLRSQMENAELVLTMRSLPVILASCTALFAVCVLTSPLVAFSLLAAAYVAPIVGTLAFETQCSVIGGSVPIAIAASIVRAEWQRAADNPWRRRVNLVAIAILFAIGCICASIPHPPSFGGI